MGGQSALQGGAGGVGAGVPKGLHDLQLSVGAVSYTHLDVYKRQIVGCALARAPEGLPCHRVLYRDGGLSPADVFGGTGIQRLLLEGEGVPFLPDGRVDLSRCLWDGGEERSTL